MSNRAGVNRFLIASLSTEAIQVNDDFEFDAPESTTGGPPEVEIPLEASTVGVQFVTRSNSPSLAIGFQITVNNKPVHTRRFRRPITLSSDCCAEIRLMQVMGFPANDTKQSTQLSGNIGCQSLCACPACGQQRKDFGNWNVLLYEMYRKGEIEAGRSGAPNLI